MTFPIINHIDDVLPSVEGRKEFVLKRGDGYTAIDYNYVEPDSFDDPIRRELRGIKFGSGGKIIARPYHKFWNLNEKPETQATAIDWSQPHHVLDKLDGSMVHPAIVNDKLVFMTRAGVTDISKDAGRFAVANGLDVHCEESLRNGWTPIFEWCSPRNQIVIKYPKDRLVMTGLRHTVTGEYGGWLSDDYPDSIYGFGRFVRNIDDFIATTRTLTGEEGYVVRFLGGFMVKMKADAYVAQHRARDGIMFEKDVLALVLDGKEDDVIPLLPIEEAERLRHYAFSVNSGIGKNAERIGFEVRITNEHCDGDRKCFAMIWANSPDRLERGLMFQILDGKDPRTQLIALIRKNCGSRTDVENILYLIGGARWDPNAAFAAEVG